MRYTVSVKKIRTLTIATLGLLTFIVQAQEWTANLYYDLKGAQTSLVATRKIGQATNILGKGKNLDLDTFIGATLDNGAPTVGVSLGKRFKFAEEVSGYLGFGANWKPGSDLSRILKELGYGPAAGVTWRF